MRRMIKWSGGLLLAVMLGQTSFAQTAGVEASVVKVVNQYNQFSWYTPWDSGSTGKGTGSGFVIKGKRIMTNAHVVSDSAMLMVYFYNDPQPYLAHVVSIGHDCDLAVLELDDPSRMEGVPELEFDGLPEIRSRVFTYGYPAGGQRISSTAGVVSRIEIQTYSHSSVDAHLSVQTDAAINPGNSGGPVIQNGRVVGVAFQGNSSLENMGFFIPVNVIDHFLTDLEDGTYDGFAEFGALAATMENPAARAYAGMNAEETGMRVEHLLKKTSAAEVLRMGDVITSIDGYAVANDGTVNWNDLRLNSMFLIDLKQMGESVSVGLIRDGKRLTLDVKLNHYNPNPALGNLYETQPTYYIYAGLVFAPLNRAIMSTYSDSWVQEINQELIYEFYYRAIEENGVMDEPCVVQIRRLDHAVNAEEAYYPYRIIESVNGTPVRTLAELAEAIESNTQPQQVIRYKYGNKITVLDREKADAAHQEILEQYSVPKDRNL